VIYRVRLLNRIGPKNRKKLIPIPKFTLLPSCYFQASSTAPAHGMAMESDAWPWRQRRAILGRDGNIARHGHGGCPQVARLQLHRVFFYSSQIISRAGYVVSAGPKTRFAVPAKEPVLILFVGTTRLKQPVLKALFDACKLFLV